VTVLTLNLEERSGFEPKMQLNNVFLRSDLSSYGDPFWPQKNNQKVVEEQAV